MMRSATCLAIAALLAPVPSWAEGDEAPALRHTLAEAVQRALRSSASLAQLRSLESAAAADLRAARAGRLPQADLSAGYTRFSDVPELTIAAPGSPPRTIFPNIPDNYRVRAGLAVPIYTGGRVEGLIDAARGESEAVGKEVQAAGAELVLEASAAYWSLVTTRASERVLAEAVRAFDAHLQDARNRRRFGMAAANEVLAVQVERDRAELARLDAENAAEIAHANLARLLGLEPERRVETAEPLERVPTPQQEVEALVARALAARPERAALRSRLAAALARVRAERAARLPQVSAAAGYDYANPNRRILPPEAVWKGSWDVSLSLWWSAFDGGRTSAAVARARARADAARHQLEDLDRRIRLQVTRARLELSSAEAAVQVAERNLEAARENRRVAADRYREGVIPSSELFDAEVGLLRAGLDRTEALTKARLALASLDRAVGE